MVSNESSRRTTNHLVLSRIDNLGHAFPDSRGHRRTFTAAASDFTYVHATELPSPFQGVWIALIRLSAELEDRFGIHQEIPVVYSPYTDVQGRTITRLREMLAYLPRDRQGYAGGLLFFWAPDPKLETKLQKFSRTELVLIPIPTGDAEELVATLAKHLYSQDLYRERTYVTGDQFFGRRNLLAELRGDLADHRVAAVFGTRKTGKTSILKELVRTSEVGGNTDLIEVFIYEDLEHLPRPESGKDPVPELLGDLAEDIRNELKLRGLRTKELADLTERPTLLEFRRALTANLRHPANLQLYLVIILDEVEHICPPNADKMPPSPTTETIPQFLGVFRKLVQELDNFNFMVAGLASAIVESGELYGRHNPLFRLANSYYMSPFTEQEASELLEGVGARLGLTWTPDAVRIAHEESGGQVVLLRELAAHAWEARRHDSLEKVTIDADDVGSVIAAYRRAVRSQITETIDHIKRYYSQEFELCNELVHDPISFYEIAEAYPAEVNRLINLGLVADESGKLIPTQILKLGWVAPRTPKAPPTSDKYSVEDLISQGEHRTLEFKASVRIELDSNLGENVVVESLVKAILGFLNAEGGKILVGVADNGSVVGLERDIKHTGRSKDQLMRFTVDKINSYLGPSMASTLEIEWKEVAGKDILVFDVPKNPTPVFPIRKVLGKEDLYVRQNANIIPLSGAELYSYITRRFQ